MMYLREDTFFMSRCSLAPSARALQIVRLFEPRRLLVSSGRAPPDIAHRSIALYRLRLASARGAIAAAAWRADHHAFAALEHVLLAVVHAAVVHAHVTAAAGRAAGQPGRGKPRALGHEAHHDRARGVTL